MFSHHRQLQGQILLPALGGPDQALLRDQECEQGRAGDHDHRNHRRQAEPSGDQGRGHHHQAGNGQLPHSERGDVQVGMHPAQADGERFRNAEKGSQAIAAQPCQRTDDITDRLHREESGRVGPHRPSGWPSRS